MELDLAFDVTFNYAATKFAVRSLGSAVTLPLQLKRGKVSAFDLANARVQSCCLTVSLYFASTVTVR
jgi:hypothetical protein